MNLTQPQIDEANAGSIAAANKANASAGLIPTNTQGPGFITPPAPVGTTYAPKEPAVLSSVAGKTAFDSKVQPAITAANTAVTNAATKTAATTAAVAAAKTAAAATAGSAIPADVQAELDGTDPTTAAYNKANQALLDGWDKQKQDAIDTASNLTIAQHSSAQAQMAALTAQWTQRRALLQQSNTANEAAWTQQFVRSGQAEYSPGMTKDMLTGKEQEGIQKLSDMDAEYNGKIGEINAALQQGLYTIAAQKTQELNALQDKANTLIQQNAKDAKTVNDTIRAKNLQAQRDGSIANLIAQGITNPADIEKLLNDPAHGNGHYTAEEIDKAVKVFTPPDQFKDFTGDYKTYLEVQKKQPDLVKGMSYFDYLAAVSNAKRKPDSGASGAITLGTNDKQALLGVGFTANDITNIQADVNAHGIDQALAGITDQRQKDALQQVYSGGKAPTTSKLTRQSVSALFGIPDNAQSQDTNGWWPGGYEANNTRLDGIMASIKKYQDVGYSDADIMKLMQK